MAWELQQHMHQYVAPSVAKLDRCRLLVIYADQRWNEDTGAKGHDALQTEANDLSDNCLAQLIADKAIEYSTTTNGGHEVYLDSWTSIEWCSEDEKLAWKPLS